MESSHDPASKTHPYAGRWIARVGSQLVSQGLTPEEVFASSRQLRFKEIPIISYIPRDTIMPFPKLFYKIQTILADYPNVFLVGGAIRDAMLGLTSHDLDFVCQEKTKEIAQKTADALKANFFTMDDEREVYRVINRASDNSTIIIDFTTMRGESIREDLLLRDFTINAMAINLQDPQKLLDPLSGAQDLKEKNILACKPSAMQDDPIRILRGVRFAAERGFRIEALTRDAMKASVHLLEATTPERRRDELFKIFQTAQPSAALRALDWLFAIPFIMPEIASVRKFVGKQWWDDLITKMTHLQKVVQTIMAPMPEGAGDLLTGMYVNRIAQYRKQLADFLDTPIHPERAHISLVYLGALLTAGAVSSHDETLPARVGMEMKLSKNEISALHAILSGSNDLNNYLLKAKTPEPVQIYHFFQKNGIGGLQAILVFLANAWPMEATKETQAVFQTALDIADILLDTWWNKHDTGIDPPIVFSGDDLMRELSLPPGPEIGLLLNEIREAQVKGEIQSREDALRWLKSHSIH